MLHNRTPPGLTFSKFVGQYLVLVGAAVAVAVDPVMQHLTALLDPNHTNAHATRFLLDQLTTKIGATLTTAGNVKLAEFCDALVKLFKKYQPPGGEPVHVHLIEPMELKNSLLEQMQPNGALQRDVHFKRQKGGSLSNGRGIELTPSGMHVALTYGLGGDPHHPLKIAYTTLMGPAQPLYRILKAKLDEYNQSFGVQRQHNLDAFSEQKMAIAPSIIVPAVEGQSPEEAAKKKRRLVHAAAMRNDIMAYRTFYVKDDTPNCMTGQLAVHEGLEPGTPAFNDFVKRRGDFKNRGTVASNLSKHKQALHTAMRLQIEDMQNDHPEIPPAKIAAIVAARHRVTQQNLAIGIDGNVLPPPEQRRKNFNHAHHLPAPALLLQQGGAAPLALAAPAAPLALPAP